MAFNALTWSRKYGLYVCLPGMARGRGNPMVTADKQHRYGFWTDISEETQRREWAFYFGSREWRFGSPGDINSREEFDPPDERVTRQIEFRGKTYTYHSGKRTVRYSNLPERRDVTAIWMPDLKHADEYPAICSMGINSDPVEVLEYMYQLGLAGQRGEY